VNHIKKATMEKRKSFYHAERHEYLFFCLCQEHKQKTLKKKSVKYRVDSISNIRTILINIHNL